MVWSLGYRVQSVSLRIALCCTKKNTPSYLVRLRREKSNTQSDYWAKTSSKTESKLSMQSYTEPPWRRSAQYGSKDVIFKVDYIHRLVTTYRRLVLRCWCKFPTYLLRLVITRKQGAAVNIIDTFSTCCFASCSDGNDIGRECCFLLQLLLVRHEFKIAFFGELKKDPALALKWDISFCSTWSDCLSSRRLLR